MMEAGLHEVMSMAEGAMFRFEKSGDRYAPPAYAVGACSVKGRPMWFQLGVRPYGDGTERCRVDIYPRGRELSVTFELWLDPDGRWESRTFAREGAERHDDDDEVGDALSDAILVRNAGLGK